jgi:hypothetical protein
MLALLPEAEIPEYIPTPTGGITSQGEHPHFSPTGEHLNHKDDITNPKEARETMAAMLGKMAGMSLFEPNSTGNVRPYHARGGSAENLN